METASRSSLISSASTWVRSCVILSCCLFFILFLYWPTGAAIVSLWHTSMFSHGFLIVPVSMYLIWTRREHLRLLTPTPAFWAIPILLLLSFAWLLAHLAAIGVVEQFCLVGMILVLFWSVFGTAVVRALLMPLAFLLFAVPFGEAFVPKLQDFSAWFAVRALDLCGVPVLLEGRFISVPTGKWEVAEACSGIRYLTSSLAVGFLFAGLLYRTWVRRIGFFIASAVVPILANAVRVFGIVSLAYVSGNRIAVGVDHMIYGWIFFTVVMGLLLSVGSWWREKSDRRTDTTASPVTVVNKTERSKANRQSSATATLALSCCSVIAVALAPVYAKFIWVPVAQGSPLKLPSPGVSPPVRSTNTDTIGWKPAFFAPNTELAQSYEIRGQQIELYIAYYSPTESQGKLISSTNFLFDQRAWSRTEEGELAVTIEGRLVRTHEIHIRSPQTSLVIWDWYWIDNTYTSNSYLAKFLLLKSQVVRDRRGAAIIAIATEDRGDQPASEVLQDFLNHTSLKEVLRLPEN